MGIVFVMKNNCKRSLHHKARWMLLLLLPLVLSLASNIFNQIQDSSIRIGVYMSEEAIHKDYQKLFPTIEEAVKTWKKLDGMRVNQASKATIQTDVIMGVYHVALDLSLPKNESILFHGSDENKTLLLKQLFQEENKHTNFDVIQDISSEKDQELTDLNPMKQSIAFLMMLFLIFSVIHGGMYIKDKENGMIQRFCYTPQKKRSYLIGNWCYLLSITLVQVVISYFIVSLVNGTWLPIFTAVKIILFITLICSIFAMLLCYLSKSETQASIVASSMTAIMGVLSGTFVPVSAMPKVLQVLSYVNPIQWCMELVGI